jgi:hypothetical protein
MSAVLRVDKAKRLRLFQAKIVLETARERLSGDPNPESEENFKAAERAYTSLKVANR